MADDKGIRLMAYNLIQANFIKGELSPLMHARVDVELFKTGLHTCENWIIMPQGGVKARPGTKFVAEVKDSTRAVRLVRFIYSTEMNYILEFGENYIRVYKEQAQVQSASVPVEITSTYSEAQLFELQFTQDENTLYIVHKDHLPATLTRTSHTAWALASMSFTGAPTEWAAANYPQRVTFYEDRLVLASTPKEPNTAWLSKTSTHENFTIGTADDDAMKVTARTGQVNAIQWMVEDKLLQFGTTAATRTLGGEGDSGLTPTNIAQRRHTTDGASSIQPVQTGAVTVFVGEKKRRLREFIYSFENDRFLAPDLTLLSEHILKPQVVEMAYAQDPFPVIWCALANGELAGCTYDPDFKIAGWHRHRLGGDAGSGWGKVESVAVIPGADHDELWMVVKRTINGATKRYIEFLTQPFDGEIMKKADAFQVDCGLSYNGASADTFSGLNHLEGETAAILAGGAIDPSQVVTSGSVSLQGGRTATKAAVGLPYTATGRSLRLGVADNEGTLLGQKTKVGRIIVDVQATLLMKAGSALNTLEVVVQRDGADPMDSSPPLYTGSKEVVIDDDWETAGQIYFVQDVPLPAMVRALTPAAVI
ncbi:MAG: hypothetical protein GY832_17570 [Chloroflexi bacterium]|nr:hypothetical protein [Chloroflexota bacterium]